MSELTAQLFALLEKQLPRESTPAEKLQGTYEEARQLFINEKLAPEKVSHVVIIAAMAMYAPRELARHISASDMKILSDTALRLSGAVAASQRAAKKQSPLYGTIYRLRQEGVM